jgi:hypothetical protein
VGGLLAHPRERVLVPLLHLVERLLVDRRLCGQLLVELLPLRIPEVQELGIFLLKQMLLALFVRAELPFPPVFRRCCSNSA